MADCEKCEILIEVYEATEQKPRDYWLMTELFVLLHNGKDYCNASYVDGTEHMMIEAYEHEGK